MSQGRTTGRTALFLAAVLVAGCNYLPFSGGALEGNLTAPPGDWDPVATPEVIEIETNPEDPYSVKLWIVSNVDKLYINAGANESTWAQHLREDERLRLKIGDALYELRAERVTSQDEFDAYAPLWESKYGNLPRNKIVEESYLFRLAPRG